METNRNEASLRPGPKSIVTVPNSLAPVPRAVGGFLSGAATAVPLGRVERARQHLTDKWSTQA